MTSGRWRARPEPFVVSCGSPSKQFFFSKRQRSRRARQYQRITTFQQRVILHLFCLTIAATQANNRHADRH